MVETLAWAGAIFIAGCFLIFERRCLGQMAVVQPLVVCFTAGWLLDEVELALWMGVSLQLFSVARVRHVDWALAGIVAAVAFTYLARLGMPVIVGGPSALVLMVAVILVGVGSKALDRYFARTDGERLRTRSPWTSENPTRAIESMVRRVSLRWFLVGGMEVMAGAGLVIGAVFMVNFFYGATLPARLPVFSAAVPTLASAVAVGALAQYRFLFFALAAVIAFAVVTL